MSEKKKKLISDLQKIFEKIYADFPKCPSLIKELNYYKYEGMNDTTPTDDPWCYKEIYGHLYKSVTDMERARNQFMCYMEAKYNGCVLN